MTPTYFPLPLCFLCRRFPLPLCFLCRHFPLLLYFLCCHSPAVLQDFIWWSGLPVSDAKQAVYLIASELTTEQWKEQTWYIHDTCRTRGKLSGHIHLLPSYDEYLLGYKDRTDVLPLEHYPKAFTNNGLFFPIVLHNGQVIGNWDKSEKKKSVDLKYSWFRQVADMDEETLERERQKFARFLGK